MDESEVATIKAKVGDRTGAAKVERLIQLLFENLKREPTLRYVLGLLHAADDAHIEFYLVEIV